MHGDTTARIEARLRELDLVLPDPPRPAGGYVSVLVRNHIGVVSGQFPFASGELPIRGRIGADVSETDGRRAAQLAALNVLAQIRAALGGFNGFTGLLRVDGWVACAPGFMSQPSILDGASQCLRSQLSADRDPLAIHAPSSPAAQVELRALVARGLLAQSPAAPSDPDDRSLETPHACRLSRSALVITETDDRLIARAAMSGLKSQPVSG